MTIKTKTILASLLAMSTLASGAAEAQTKYYARTRINADGATAAPAAPVYTGTWKQATVGTEGACGSNHLRPTTKGSTCYDSNNAATTDSMCDPATKPTDIVNNYACISCNGSLVGTTTSGYGPTSYTSSYSGGSATYFPAASLSQAQAKYACEHVGAAAGGQNFRGCNLGYYSGTYYAEMFTAPGSAAQIGTKGIPAMSYKMDCSE